MVVSFWFVHQIVSTRRVQRFSLHFKFTRHTTTILGHFRVATPREKARFIYVRSRQATNRETAYGERLERAPVAKSDLPLKYTMKKYMFIRFIQYPGTGFILEVVKKNLKFDKGSANWS